MLGIEPAPFLEPTKIIQIRVTRIEKPPLPKIIQFFQLLND